MSRSAPARSTHTLASPERTTPSRSGDAEARLERIRYLTKMLDSAWQIPGTKMQFGLDSLIGLFPGVGDAATAAVSGYIVYEASKMGVSKWTLMRMSTNVLLDVLVGTVPVLGDIFDLAFKANVRNLKLLEKHQARQTGRNTG